MENQADHLDHQDHLDHPDHLDPDQSLGRVSARAVLASIRSSQQPAPSRTLPRTLPNSSESTLTTPSLSSPNNFRSSSGSPPPGGSPPDSARVLPLPPTRKKHLETPGRSGDRGLSSDDGDTVRGDKTPDSLSDHSSLVPSLDTSDSNDNPPPFSSLSLPINVDESPSLETNDPPPEQGHRKVERTGNRTPDVLDSDKVTAIVKPDIKLVSPSPTDDSPEDQEVNPKGKREDKIPLTKISSSIRSSIRSKLSSSEKPTEDGSELKRKLSGKPSSRLSVEHQLLGVSSSTLSNCTDQNEADCITVNEAIQKAGLGRYHALPFVAAAMVIVLKCFLDGVPDNFLSMFQCVFSIDKDDTQLLVLLGFIGSVVGAPIGGALADKFGRRLITVVGLVLLVIITAVVTGAPHPAVLTTFYVIFSMLISAIHPVILVYVMELSPTKSRYITLTLCFVCYSLVSFIIPLVIMPFYQRQDDFKNDNWRIAWGVLMVPIFACIGILYFSPASPRFKAAKGKSKEAQTTVFNMLERNLGDKLRLSLSNLELSTNSDPSISGISLAKLFYRPIQGTTILLTAFLFVCNVQYFASHVLTEEMLTNRCSCGVDITSKGTPWTTDLSCDFGLSQYCDPDDAKDRTCCHNKECKTVEEVIALSNKTLKECPKEGVFPCHSVHKSVYGSWADSSDTEHCKMQNVSKYYVFNAVRNVLYVLGFAIGILLAQYTSRKDAFIHLAFYITFINGLLFAVCRFLRGTTFLMFVTSLAFNTVIGAVYSLSWLYMLEYYPTSLRCSGVGYLAGMGQLGNGVGTLISKYTLEYNLNVNGRLTIHLFLSNLLTVLSFMLELETKRLPMSDRKRVDCLDHKLSSKEGDQQPS